MVSIAGVEGKVFRMMGNGTIPAETLWQVDDVNRLPPAFSDPAHLEKHPLEMIRDVVLMCGDVADVRDLNSWSGSTVPVPRPSNRHVSLVWGTVCVALAVWLIFGQARGWLRVVSLFLFLFGAFSLKTAFFGSDKEIRELTTDEPHSRSEE